MVGLIVTYLAVWLSRPTDEQLIIEALDTSISKSMEGGPGGIFEKFYADVMLQLEGEIPKSILSVGRGGIEVTVPHRAIELRGNSASITSPLYFNIPELGNLFPMAADVKVIFSAETEMKLFIVPVRTWRVTDVQYQGNWRFEEK